MTCCKIFIWYTQFPHIVERLPKKDAPFYKPASRWVLLQLPELQLLWPAMAILMAKWCSEFWRMKFVTSIFKQLLDAQRCLKLLSSMVYFGWSFGQHWRTKKHSERDVNTNILTRIQSCVASPLNDFGNNGVLTNNANKNVFLPINYHNHPYIIYTAKQTYDFGTIRPVELVQ